MNPQNLKMTETDIQKSFDRLYEWAALNQIYIETIQKDSEEDLKRREKNMANARTNETSKLGNDYRVLVMNFKSKNKIALETFKQEHPNIIETDEALKIIINYELQLPMRITQAYVGLSEFVETTTDPFQIDFNRSAKIVLTGIENSFFAWEKILQNIPGTKMECMQLLILLDRIYKRILADFPHADAIALSTLNLPGKSESVSYNSF